MTKVISWSKELRIAAKNELKYVAIDGELSVFQLTRTQVPMDDPYHRSFEYALGSGVIEGFAKLKEVAKFAKGSTSSINQLEHLSLVHPDYQKFMRELGFTRGFEQMPNGSEVEDKMPFTAFTSGNASLDNVVRIDSSSHMLFDRNGEVLPVAIHFSYMNGNMNDGAYRLKLAADLLSNNLQVRIKNSDHRGVIHEVPYYNSEDGCREGLEFDFLPTVEDVRRMWVVQKKLNKQYPSTCAHHAIFDLDLLGLREGGAAKWNDYYGSDRYSDSGRYSRDGDDE